MIDIVGRSIGGIKPSELAKISGPSNVNGKSFADTIGSLLQNASDAGQKADLQSQWAATGKANVVDVVTAVAESETSLQTLVAVRDKFLSAYEEVMRMQI